MTTTVKNNSEVVHSGTTISIDAMGGDLGPSAIVSGLVRAAKINDSIHFLLHGKSELLKKLVNKRRSLVGRVTICLLYTSPSPRDRQKSRMPSSA